MPLLLGWLLTPGLLAFSIAWILYLWRGVAWWGHWQSSVRYRFYDWAHARSERQIAELRLQGRDDRADRLESMQAAVSVFDSARARRFEGWFMDFSARWLMGSMFLGIGVIGIVEMARRSF